MWYLENDTARKQPKGEIAVGRKGENEKMMKIRGELMRETE